MSFLEKKYEIVASAFFPFSFHFPQSCNRITVSVMMGMQLSPVSVDC
jgi:hypothetical protein